MNGMFNLDLYPYITEDNLENRQYYMYTKYSGVGFLQGYEKIRLQALSRLSLQAGETTKEETVFNCLENLNLLAEVSRHPLVCRISKKISVSKLEDAQPFLDKLVHAFEIRKRLHREYDSAFKPVNIEDYLKPEPYVALAAALAFYLHNKQNLKYLNTLLKLIDSILSIEDRLTPLMKQLTIYSIQTELAQITGWIMRKGIST